MSIRTEFGASEGENPPGRGSDCNPPSPSDAEDAAASGETLAE